MPPPRGQPFPPIGKIVLEAGPGLLDAALRLLRLLDDPKALRVLRPLAEQEILYHLFARLAEFCSEHLAPQDSRRC